MLVILEGNECNYKTTVAEKLSKKTGMSIIKGSSFEQSKFTNEKLFNNFKEILSLKNTIVDRYIFSNLVYASLYDDYSIINTLQREIIESELIKNESVVVYLYSDVDVLSYRLGNRGDDYVKQDKLQAINDKYSEVLSETTVPILHVNTKSVSSTFIANYIYKLIKT
ncbi:hypothetical protein [Brevibacillus porteri]|uniref:hypothetical protein n=1 Tax=Brevibacillus porteri TaxID=2126350 RepID=UPI003629ED86